MKFISNKLFTYTIHKILDSREEALKEQLEANFDEITDKLSNLDAYYIDFKEITDKLSNLDAYYIDFEEITYKLSNLEEMIKNSEYVEKEKVLEYIENEIKEKTFYLSDSSDLERLISSQNQNYLRMETLEQENQDLKERLLTLENFLLKTFKTFKEFNND